MSGRHRLRTAGSPMPSLGHAPALRGLLRLTLLAVTYSITMGSPATATETSLVMSSQPGDYVGGGQQYSYDLSSAVFTPTLLGSGEGVETFVNAGNFQHWWYLRFAAADGAPLTTGTYVDAMRYGTFSGGGHPGIDVYGDGRGCNQQAGAFRVKQLTVSNGVVTRLWVQFEQHCEGAAPALTGDLRLNADVTLLVDSPFGRKLPVGQLVTFEVTGRSPAAEQVTLVAEGLPAGATFEDHGDNTGTFRWTPAADQVGSYGVTFVGTSPSGQDRSTTLLDITEPPLTGDTSLRMESEPGDYIGRGQPWFFGAGDGTFAGYRYNGGPGVAISFRNTQHSWSLVFFGAGGTTPLPGLYLDARRAPVFDASHPGLAVSGDGSGCNMLTGAFEVKQLVISDNLVTRFWGRFEQHCEGAPPALTGEIRLNADVAVAVVAPFHRRIERGQPLAIDVTATAEGGGHVTLSVQGLPEGAVFEDHGDNTGRLSWTPTAGQLGSYTLVFAGDDGQGHTDHSTTLLEVTGLTSLRIDSEPDEPLARGADAFYGPSDGAFSVTQGFYDKSVRYRFQTPSYSAYWDITLGAPNAQPLLPGTYEDVVGGYVGGDRPFLNLSTVGVGCGDLRGRFVVRQADYGPDNVVRAFWATFEETCTGSTAPLRGELRFNAAVITDVTAPSSFTLTPGEPVEFAVTATNVAGRHVVLTAGGVPSGGTFVDHGDNTGTFTWTPTFEQIGRYRVSFTGDDGAGGVDSAATYLRVPGETSLILRESPSGPQVLTPADGTFTGVHQPNHHVGITFSVPGLYQGWHLEFGASGNAPLQPGFYPGASVLQLSGNNLPPPTYPVLDANRFDFLVSCSPTTGLFQIKQVALGEGGELQGFWATFEEHCREGRRTVGEIRFNARVEVALQAPLSAEIAPGEPLEIAVSASDRLGRHVTLGALDLPAGASFLDHGDNSGVMIWTPRLDDIGLHDLTFVGDNGSGGVDRAQTHVRVSGQVRLVVDGDPQDPVGGGRSGVFGPADGPFELWKNYKEGVSLHFTDRGTYYLPEWFLDLAAPRSAPLAPGSYEPVAQYPYEPDETAGLSLTHGYDPCSGIEGRFEIQDITYGPGVEITALRATFEQRCAGSTASVRGELRWHYDAPVTLSAPMLVDTTDGVELRVSVTGKDRRGGVLTLTATGLPAGATFVDHQDDTGELAWPSTVPGDYTVAFHGRNTQGEEDSVRTRIRVHHINRPPVAALTFASPVVAGVPVTFDATGSHDPDGDALQFFWSFSDGGYGSGPTIAHTFATPGYSMLMLYVFDGTLSAERDSLIRVAAIQPARAFVSGGDAVVRLGAGKPSTCVQIEPRDGAWEVGDAVISSIAMVSVGTGSVSRIGALEDKSGLDGDTDHNGVSEIRACFSKEDLRRLFSGISNRGTVAVTLEGKLHSGDFFRAGLDLLLAKPTGPLSAFATPLEDHQGYRLAFETTRPGTVRIRLFDVSGRCVRSLAGDAFTAPGEHEVVLERRDLRSGIYFYRIDASEGVAGGRLIWLK